MANRLLIVEDDRDLARNLIEYLELQGYVTDFAADGQTALQLVAAEQFDLVVLDLMLPVIDGLSVCTRIRQQLHSNVPVVMLTAKDEVDLKVAALDIGADDYVVKPASLREIEARIRALIRRASREVESDVLIVDDLRFDTGTMKIERAGVPIVLPPVPMRILMLLMRRSPNVVHRQAIHREIWGDEPGDAHALIVHMHMLRNAVDKPFFRQIIHTVRGFGYRIAYEPEAL
ncbi:MAG TPA: response regulator transcription factor [Nitrospira sp.]|nr:response regulator transcription factor [Rhodocyclaceae bacterium]HNL88793.1 response regulator transcription factor [Nitrospira sp.]HNM81682.1 response regulator transcription factor [Rhodocyclaceae bacterium]